MEPDSASRIGLIGASGFVGQAIGRAFARLTPDTDVVALNRPDFDLTRPETWSMLAPPMDCVVHAAGLREGSRQDLFDVNTLPIAPLAERCNMAGVKKFVYLSTGAVYGNSAKPAQPGMPVNPGTSYAEAKRQAEKDLQKIFQGRTCILRLYFPYGRGQSLPRLLPMICDRISREVPIHCNPDGGPHLNVAHVDDVAEVIVEDFILGSDAPPLANIASDQIISIESLVNMLAARLGKEPKLVRDGAEPETNSVPYCPGRWREFDAADVI